VEQAIRLRKASNPSPEELERFAEADQRIALQAQLPAGYDAGQLMLGRLHQLEQKIDAVALLASQKAEPKDEDHAGDDKPDTLPLIDGPTTDDDEKEEEDEQDPTMAYPSEYKLPAAAQGANMADTVGFMDALARSRARRDGVSLAEGYRRLLTENPGIYTDYLDEREQNMLTTKSKREYLAQLAAKFAAQGRGTQTFLGKLAPLPAAK